MRRLTQEEFIKRINNIHGGKIDVSNSKYINQETKVIAKCIKHGDFSATPDSLLQGHGCPFCKKERLSDLHSITQEEFIKRAKKVHGDTYDYSNVEYKNSTTKVKIICKTHGIFEQVPNSHLMGRGCPICANNINYDTCGFIKRAMGVHGKRYDYSNTKYINSQTKVNILCKKHGEFFQMPSSHLSGKGCPKCASSMLENKVRVILETNGEKPLEKEKIKWLHGQSVDFYLPSYGVAIECQGIQHFKAIGFFGGDNGFTDNLERDLRKNRELFKNGVKIIYIIDKENLKYSLNEEFQHIYDDALCIDDVLANPNILIDRIKKSR